eukprot:g2950.t1
MQATSCKKAIEKWCEVTKKDPKAAKEVKLIAMMPPIKKMDAAQLSALAYCEKLSMSTNSIERMAALKMPHLKILSLGRNKLSKIDNLKSVSSTLEQLWISYNFIGNLDGVLCCKKLKTLYISNNKIRAWSEVQKLRGLPELRDLVLAGNDICKDMSTQEYRVAVLKAIPQITKIDGKLVTPIERQMAEES